MGCKALGGAASNLRLTIVALCRTHFDARRDAGSAELSDDKVVGAACDLSSRFCGLWKLIDIEIRLAVEPFILWEQGDFRPFLRALPSMRAFIASGYKPKVPRC